MKGFDIASDRGQVLQVVHGGLFLCALLSALLVKGWNPGFVGIALAMCVLMVAIHACIARDRIELKSLDIMVILFTSWVITVTLFRELPWVADYQLTLFLLLPLGYVLARADEGITWNALWLVLVLLAAAIALATLVLAALGEPRNVLFTIHNNQAAFLNIALLLLAFRGPSQRPMRPWLNHVLVVLLAAAVAVIGSRGAFVGLCTGLLCMMLVIPRGHRRALVPYLLALAAGIVIGNLAGAGYLTTRVASLADPLAAGGSRLIIWHSAIPLLLEQPLAGFGLGMTEFVWAQHRLAVDNSLGIYLHNDYLQFALEAGWPAALMLMLLPLMVFIAAFRANSTDMRIPAALAAFISIAVHCVFDYHLQLPLLALLFGYLLGATALTDKTTIKLHMHAASMRWTTIGFVLLLFIHGSLLVAYEVALPWQDTRSSRISDTYMLNVSHHAEPMRPEAADAYMDRLRLAMRLQPRADAPKIAYAGMLRHRGRLEAAHRYVSDALALNPYAYQAHYQKALIALDQGNRATAEDALKQALQRYPRFLAARSLLVEMLLEAGRLDEANDHVKTSLQHRRLHSMSGRNFHEYLHVAESVAERSGDLEALELVQKARLRTSIPGGSL